MSQQKPNDKNMSYLLENFRDLNTISKHISDEMKQKNQILSTGLKDCTTCTMYLNMNTAKKSSQANTSG